MVSNRLLQQVAIFAVLVFSCLGLAFAQDCPQWQLVSTTGPSPRAGHAMAYDSSRGVIVLFGGGSDSFQSNDTWEWDGNGWGQRMTDGPAPRIYHSMAWDERRGVIVLFGGRNRTEIFGDTWEYDGSAWNQLPVDGPIARAYHAIAYDASRQVVVLFGGRGCPGDDRCGDTWEWDGQRWEERTTGGPRPRFEHAMAYDSHRRVSVLFGGSHGGRETWEWNGATWSLRDPLGVGNKIAHAMSFDRADGLAVVYGGLGSDETNTETWFWDGVVWTLRAGLEPTRRTSTAMAYDSRRDVTVLFGGFSGSYRHGDTWELQSCSSDSDRDGDGVPNGEDDTCPLSDSDDQVHIGDCDTGVSNNTLDGCTMADRIAECGRDPSNPGEFASCVADQANQWMRDDVINAAERGAIQRCAARAEVPAIERKSFRGAQPASPLGRESSAQQTGEASP